MLIDAEPPPDFSEFPRRFMATIFFSRRDVVSVKHHDDNPNTAIDFAATCKSLKKDINKKFTTKLGLQKIMLHIDSIS
jgi:hypothetical protein